MARTKRDASRIQPQTKPGSHHDGLFHLAFSVPKNATSELKTLLSSEIVARIKWDKLRNVSGKFVDAKLTNRHSDILFEVEIDDEKVLIYVLYEHKSDPDRWTLLQILEYKVRIWREYLRKNQQKTQLPVILPVVVHHGESGWTTVREFGEYFDNVPEELRRHIPNFGIVLDDVGKVSPEKLLGRRLTPEAKLVLLCLQLGRTPGRFLEELRRHPAALRRTWHVAENSVVISAIIVYLGNIGGVAEEETVKVMQDILKLSPAEEILFADKVLAHRAERRGEERGRLEGKLEGEIKEALALVTKLLTKRFGPLSPEVTVRLQAATKTELEDIGLRVLSAATLEEALGKPKRKRTPARRA